MFRHSVHGQKKMVLSLFCHKSVFNRATRLIRCYFASPCTTSLVLCYLCFVPVISTILHWAAQLTQSLVMMSSFFLKVWSLVFTSMLTRLCADLSSLATTWFAWFLVELCTHGSSQRHIFGCTAFYRQSDLLPTGSILWRHFLPGRRYLLVIRLHKFVDGYLWQF